MQAPKTQALPNSYEIEKAVLGAVIIDSTAFYTVNDLQKITAADFYNNRLSRLYSIVVELQHQKRPIDLITVAEKIKVLAETDGEKSYIFEAMLDCTNSVCSSAHLDGHVLMLKELSMRRQIIYKAYDAVKNAYDTTVDVFDIAQKHQKEVMGITDNLTTPPEDVAQLFDKLDGVVFSGQQEQSIVCRTELHELDRFIGGIEKDDILTVAGVSGSGKTAFICGIVDKFLRVGKPVIIFSYEMTAIKLLMRIVCACSEIDYDNLKSGRLDEADKQHYLATKDFLTKNGMLQIYDCAGVPAQGLLARAMAAKMRLKEIGCIMIDYIQLIRSEGYTRDENAVTKDVMLAIIGIMKRCECPVIPLSQITKSVGTSRPQIFNLYGAQIIEATSTKVLIVHRPEKFGIYEFEDGTNAAGKAEILIAKNREGQAGNIVKVDYKGSFYKFDNEGSTSF